MSILKAIKGKTFVFVLTKYSTLALKVFRTFFLATVLGPYYYGVWGFILLVQQYLLYSDLGTKFSLNVLISVDNSKSTVRQQKIFTTAFLVVTVLGIAILSTAVIIKVYNVLLFEKYNFNDYVVYVGAIAALMLSNQMFINLFRSFGKLYNIAFYELALQVFIIPFIFIYKENQLLLVLLRVILLVNLLGYISFFLNSPVKLHFDFDIKIFKRLIVKGVNLFFYNMSFYLIILSSKTIVSKYLRVEQMGQFTLLVNISATAFLGLKVISWMIFPKALNRMNIETPNDKAEKTILYLRSIYMPAMFLIIYSIIGTIPLLKILLPSYSEGISSLSILILTQGILLSGYGYGIINIARNKELKMSGYGFIVVIINIILALSLLHYVSAEIRYIVISLFISVIIYPVLQIKLALKSLEKSICFRNILNIIFPYYVLIPSVLSLIIYVLNLNDLFYLIIPALFILLNINNLLFALFEGKKIFTNPATINI